MFPKDDKEAKQELDRINKIAKEFLKDFSNTKYFKELVDAFLDGYLYGRMESNLFYGTISGDILGLTEIAEDEIN